ncbi:MAG: helix-turn-helix transcriptional regulator [Chloroflexi bacterium]|nr:MAG: helix-turn-helix transcriptional regulator [Chloroflexota bacterium]
MPTLRELREGAVLSQQDLAELAGVARTTISDFERGQRKKPHPRTIRRLAKALGCKPQEVAIAVSQAGSRG